MDTPVPLPFSSTRAYLLEARYRLAAFTALLHVMGTLLMTAAGLAQY